MYQGTGCNNCNAGCHYESSPSLTYEGGGVAGDDYHGGSIANMYSRDDGNSDIPEIEESEFDKLVDEGEEKAKYKRGGEHAQDSPRQAGANFFLNEELIRQQEERHKADTGKVSDGPEKGSMSTEPSIEDMITNAIAAVSRN